VFIVWFRKSKCGVALYLLGNVLMAANGQLTGCLDVNECLIVVSYYHTKASLLWEGEHCKIN
jgi:hypothetical protein